MPREDSKKCDIISNLLNNYKVLSDNEEKLSNFDTPNFENPKRVVKANAMSEDKTKSNNFPSLNRFSCLNNYKQFENSADFNKEIVHNVIPSNKSSKLPQARVSTDISCTKERSKPVRDKTASSKHSTVPIINSNQEY